MATHEDFSEPILEGEGESDYERYLNTVELLALQKKPDEWVHRDELLFQTVHQSSELWLKLAWSDAEAATEHCGGRDRGGAAAAAPQHALPPVRDGAARHARAHVALGVPGDPQGARPRQRLRLAGLARDPPRVAALGQAFHALREQAGLSLVDVYVQGREHEELYQLAEALIELDERINFWRIRHYKVVARVIGDSVVGTQGTPVEVLGRLIHHVFFPELWRVRNELTALSQEQQKA